MTGLWCVLTADPAAAQVNTDALVGPPAVAGPALGVSGSAGLSTGNVASLWWRADATTVYVTLFPEDTPEDAPGDDTPPWMRDRALLYGSATRASYSGEVVDDHGLAHARYTRMWVRRVGTEAFAQLQYDRFVDLRERLLLGGGVRFDAVHTARVGVWGGTGAMFERETLSEGTVNLAVRSTSYLTVRAVLVPDHLTLNNTAYVQPRVDLPADVRVLDEARLASTVTRTLSFGTDLVLRHDSRPPEGVQTTDLRVGASIQLKWPPPP